ncbi:MAG TPA: alpha/beta fold hydrolase [Bryobacteraceae bacterium]|nr:alpha/beta fold hydrolase [Bryobacteraceae bacterium]
MKRREFVARTSVLGLSGSLCGMPSDAEGYDRQWPDMLASHLVSGLNRLAAETEEVRKQIRTAADLKARNQYVRQKVVEMVGGFPERNPLEARIVKVIERPGYRVENVMFQSRPNFWVTGNLYVPSNVSGPMPAIISPCGHYPLARMLPSYQLAYQSLVKSGFVVLAFDPIGQGERRQYWNPSTGVTEVGSATYEHSMPGQLLFLFGETLTGYRVWDAMRSIDYLLTRKEVDGARIGCTGHSGGGTLTMFTSAVDERIQCAVIHEGGTRNRWPVRLSPFSPLGPSDVEQNLFPSAFHHIDHGDLHVAIAPRPLMATIERYSPDFEMVANHVRDRYRLLGVPDQFKTVSADDPHAWTYRLRVATTDWFSRWFHKRPGPTSEPEFQPEPPEDLRCLPNGSIHYSKHGETIWTTIRAKAEKLPPRESDGEKMRAGIRRLLRFRKLDQGLSPRPAGDVEREGYTIEKLAFLSESSIYIPTWVFRPKQRRPEAPLILYCNESGKDGDGMEFESAEAAGVKYGVLATLAKRGYQVVAVDVRGIGETRPAHRPASSGGEFHHLFEVETALSYMAWFQNSSLFGMRVQDVLRSVDYALSRPDANRAHVWVIGKDMGALWALYAAALDPRIEAVVCHRGLLSYRSLTQGDRYLHGANVIVPRVLEHFDLPQVAGVAAGRRVALMSPVDAMKRPVALDKARQDYQRTRDMFDAAKAPGKFQIVAHDPDEDLAAQYLRLLS